MPMALLLRQQQQNKKNLKNSREFIRFAGTALGSGSSKIAGIPNSVGTSRMLIDGTIFSIWLVVGMLVFFIIGKINQKWALKNSCDDDEIFEYVGSKKEDGFSFQITNSDIAEKTLCSSTKD